MRVLIVGASGYVGRCLCKILSESYKVFGTFYRNPVSFEGERTCVDIRDDDAVQNLVDRVRPDIIFHLAWDLNDLEGCIVAGTKNLLRAKNEHCSTSRFIFISTDAVFDGENGPYKESDIPRPVWPYGVAKRKAELEVLAAGGTVVRTSLVYGFNPTDPRTDTLLEGLKTGIWRYSYFTDEIRCPIFVDNLCSALFELAYADNNEMNILHIAGPEAISRYEFACKLARFLEHDPERIPRGIKSDSGEIRPLNLSMDIFLAKTLFKTKLRSIEEVLDRRGLF